MMQLLGLLDTLEATILNGKKVMMTDKVMVNEGQLLEIIDKIRGVIKSGGNAAKQAIERVSSNDVFNEKTILSKAQREARLIKEGANTYADETLSNLLATVLKLERSLESGRQRLSRMREEAE